MRLYYSNQEYYLAEKEKVIILRVYHIRYRAQNNFFDSGSFRLWFWEVMRRGFVLNIS